VKLTDKKNHYGEYYTPQSLAQFVVWSAFQHFFRQKLPIKLLKILQYNIQWKTLKHILNDSICLQMQKEIENIKILDLGVGNGAFLLAAGNFLEAIYPRTNPMDLINTRLKLIQNNFYGVDYSPHAVNSCREKLRNWIFGDINLDPSSTLINETEKALKAKIRLGNVLLGEIFPNDHKKYFQDETIRIDEQRIFHWHEEFPLVFDIGKPGFDLVLCNPPYVTKDILPDDIRIYRQLYQKQIFVNRFNLYHLFFVRVNDLLARNGISVFLTSNSILTDQYSSKIRDFLFSQFSIRCIVDFVSRTQIFPTVLQGACILVLRKKNGTSEQKTKIIRTVDMITLSQGKIISGCISTPRLFYFNKIIPTPHIKTLEILDFLRKNSILLKDLFKIQSGEIRPADRKIRPYYFKKIPGNYTDSDLEIVLNGKNISPYLINLNESRQKPRWYKRPANNEKRIFRDYHALYPRIVIQRITAREQLRRVVAGKINKKHLRTHKRIWVENNINYLLLDKDWTSNWLVSADALLGVFNSLLINWYVHQINLTAAIPPTDLGLIPLPQKQFEKHDQWQLLHRKVSIIQKLLQGHSSSSEKLTLLCPVCTSTGKISQLQSEINDLVFHLYELPEIYQIEILKQLRQHHRYFNHH